jgi:septal ring factor EnvC (AmiA/AmiB activator)
MKSNLLNRAAGLLTVALFLAFSFSTIAQNQDMQNNRNNDENKYTQTADELTQNLSQRVNLTEEQRSEISTTLVDYQKNISEMDPNLQEADKNSKISEIHEGIRSDIENIFNDNQMTAYNEYKDQWWRDVQTKIHPSTVRQSETQDRQY